MSSRLVALAKIVHYFLIIHSNNQWYAVTVQKRVN